MIVHNILALRDAADRADAAAKWFHSHWRIPETIYLESIQKCINHRGAIPQWYLVIDSNNKIIAGCGLIENDFHTRKDLTPNLCALYVESAFRKKGIAKALLDFVRKDACVLGLQKLYLLTDHTDFYEKCGWDFLCTVADDDGNEGRIYAADCT